MVLSVVGGNAEKNISANIVEALKLAKSVGARITGVVVATVASRGKWPMPASWCRPSIQQTLRRIPKLFR
jgi:hypothetical protein